MDYCINLWRGQGSGVIHVLKVRDGVKVRIILNMVSGHLQIFKAILLIKALTEKPCTMDLPCQLLLVML